MPAPQQVRRNPAQRPQSASPTRPQPRPAQQPQQPDPEPEAQDEDPFASQVAQVGEDNGEGYADDDLPEVFDLSDVEAQDSNIEVLPAGSYHGWVEEVDYRRSNNSGDPMFEWIIRVEKPDGSGDVPIWWYTSFGDTSVARTKGTLQKFFPDYDMAQLNAREIQGMLPGRRVLIQLRVKVNPPQHEYPGKRNQVRSVQPEPESFLEG